MENIKEKKNMTPTISIILPVYNSQKYIKNTLQSIINQTYTNYEIIIINDGTTDKSIEIIEKTLKNTYINHQIHHQENQGVSHARNKGLQKAQGEYIIFVDSDDEIHPEHIETLYTCIQKENTDFAFTQMIIKKENKTLTSPDAYQILEGKTTLTGYQLIKHELMMNIPFRFCQIMYKKEIIDKAQLKFTQNVTYGEDTEFALKALLYAKTIAYTEKTTYYYLQNDTSSTSQSFLERFNFIQILEDLSKYYHDYKMPKEELLDYPYLQEIIDLIENYRIPKAIFGNLMYLFYKDYPYDEAMETMEKINYQERLRRFKPYSKKDLIFLFKTQIFLINPKIYYKLWKTFKNSI